MKQLLSILLLITLVSCNNEKILQLPEIANSDITEVLDVSPAYIFYDKTKKDSVELNRKNLISTTNWLVNVDKRLTLKQAIPQIMYLQEKKRNAKMHKNEAAKNYFTCNNTSIKNLGFIEFTDVVYLNEVNYKENQEIAITNIIVDDVNEIQIITSKIDIYNANKSTLIDVLSDSLTLKEEKIVLGFNKNLSFQDYITFKSLLKELKTDSITISNNEFIY